MITSILRLSAHTKWLSHIQTRVFQLKLGLKIAERAAAAAVGHKQGIFDELARKALLCARQVPREILPSLRRTSTSFFMKAPTSSPLRPPRCHKTYRGERGVDLLRVALDDRIVEDDANCSEK